MEKVMQYINVYKNIYHISVFSFCFSNTVAILKSAPNPEKCFSKGNTFFFLLGIWSSKYGREIEPGVLN